MADVRPINFTATASESDLNSGNFLWLDTPQKAKKLPGDALAPKSSISLLNINKLLKTTTEYTLSQAIEAVPSNQRNLGQIIIFRTSGSKEVAYIYTAALTDDEHWQNLEYWKCIPLYTVDISNLSITSLSSIVDDGFYFCPTEYLSSLTDLPSFEHSASFTLNVRQLNSTHVLQTVRQSNGDVYSRHVNKSNGTANAWSSDELLTKNGLDALDVTSLSNVTRVGFYFCPTAYVSSINDAPPFGSIASFTLEVYNLNDTYVLQVAVQSNGETFTRHVNKSNGTHSAWISLTNMVFRGSVISLGYTSLESCKAEGFYFVKSTELSSISDLPSGLSGTSFVLTVARGNDPFNVQTIETLDNRTYRRYSPRPGYNNNPGAWVEFPKPSGIARTRLAALGDSITQGYWSDSEGALHVPTAGVTWPDYVGRLNDWSVVNYGLGGSGYVHAATVSPYRNATEIVDNVDFTQFDIVTLAFGVNDWHYSCDIGDLSTSTVHDDTLVGNMRYCIEKILDQNPKIKIVVILPFNSSKFGGNFASNWGLGTSLETSGTLQSVIDKIKSVCEYYNLQYIDTVNNNVVNRYNIEEVLGDGLHPLQDLYIPIAKCLSKQIKFS